ncbi:ribosome biogenesis GTP-binding protein YihA/YsxC [Porticoccus sp. W117]|uniref:ribosome biogenesis GTP-binding protein YihA/YsxC n=1 Tax=Porticoccus sp. W117 TaxID=3054777 RepID=UPI002592D992|nr:ribosome biogenesis GTP-binding protein YihA/YsxC [Porticoccus sp. W117]MDM3870512.1 ribosome biogenesis GTP-binding protein YihA/YsxC [Porticoccus sp. W117]
MTLRFTSAIFTQSSPTLAQCPPDKGSEVAFAGRSNAGKSSALNSLTDNHKLARTSKTPGRTQLINFFQLSDNQRLVDLPGYGFAKVPKAMKERWDRNLAEYLQERQSLRGLVLLMDIRHPLQPYDLQMVKWAADANMPTHILLTKADKLKRGPGQNTLQKVRKELKQLGLDNNISVQTFSAPKKEGLKELEKVLRGWLGE